MQALEQSKSSKSHLRAGQRRVKSARTPTHCRTVKRPMGRASNTPKHFWDGAWYRRGLKIQPLAKKAPAGAPLSHTSNEEYSRRRGAARAWLTCQCTLRAKGQLHGVS